MECIAFILLRHSPNPCTDTESMEAVCWLGISSRVVYLSSSLENELGLQIYS